MLRPFAGLVAALLLLAACGDGDSSPVGATESNLDEIKSGRLELTLLSSESGADDDEGVGFSMRGRFAVAEEEGQLPVADLQYTRITGDRRRTTRFVSTGAEAFAVVDGDVEQLTGRQLEDLRAGEGGGEGGLDGLHLDDWFDEPTVKAGPQVDGVTTEQITGPVDAVPAMNDLLTLSQDLGVPQDEAPRLLEGDGANRFRRAVRSAEAELLTGKEDRLLRRLRLTIRLEPSATGDLREVLRDLTGVRLSFSLAVTDVNQPVQVRPPED
jgi:hypothetical protein